MVTQLTTFPPFQDLSDTYSYGCRYELSAAFGLGATLATPLQFGFYDADISNPTAFVASDVRGE